MPANCLEKEQFLLEVLLKKTIENNEESNSNTIIDTNKLIIKLIKQSD